MNEIIISGEKYGVKVFDECINKVKKLAADCQNKEFAIAAAVADCNENATDNDFELCGFKGILDFIKDAMNYKSSAAYNLLNVAKHMKRIQIGKQKYVYRFALWSDYCEYSGEIYTPEYDFTIGKLTCMFQKGYGKTWGYEDLLIMCKEGKLTPSMNCNEIRTLIKGFLNPEQETEEPETEEPETEEPETEEPETEEPETEEPEMITFTLQGEKYSIPADILEKYKV